jgi:hypothetical protein
VPGRPVWRCDLARAWSNPFGLLGFGLLFYQISSGQCRQAGTKILLVFARFAVQRK